MAHIRVKLGINAYGDTLRAINRAQDGDTIIVPNEECAKLVRNHKGKLLFVEVKS